MLFVPNTSGQIIFDEFEKSIPIINSDWRGETKCKFLPQAYLRNSFANGETGATRRTKIYPGSIYFEVDAIHINEKGEHFPTRDLPKDFGIKIPNNAYKIFANSMRSFDYETENKVWIEDAKAEWEAFYFTVLANPEREDCHLEILKAIFTVLGLPRNESMSLAAIKEKLGPQVLGFMVHEIKSNMLRKYGSQSEFIDISEEAVLKVLDGWRQRRGLEEFMYPSQESVLEEYRKGKLREHKTVSIDRSNKSPSVLETLTYERPDDEEFLWRIFKDGGGNVMIQEGKEILEALKLLDQGKTEAAERIIAKKLLKYSSLGSTAELFASEFPAFSGEGSPWHSRNYDRKKIYSYSEVVGRTDYWNWSRSSVRVVRLYSWFGLFWWQLKEDVDAGRPLSEYRKCQNCKETFYGGDRKVVYCGESNCNSDRERKRHRKSYRKNNPKKSSH